MKRPREIYALLFLLLLGTVPRLILVSRFPTIPVSDFHSLVAFAVDMRQHGLSHVTPWYWEFYNPGLPLALSFLLRIVPSMDPAGVARLSTALVCGIFPLAPFLIWRGVLPFWVRFSASAALALWPGQVLFSGVVAQDNWILLPAVTLAALAVRRLVSTDSGHPVAAGLLYAAGVAIRQEALVVLFPLLLVAGGVSLRAPWRRAIATALAAGVPLLALAFYRYESSGRFTLVSEHAGVTVLGAYIPGASADGWIEPSAFISSARPDLLRDEKLLRAGAMSLAIDEALRRPGFHAARILAAISTHAVSGDGMLLYWSLQAPDVLPAALQQGGAALAARAGGPLRFELTAIQVLFIASAIIGIRLRNRAILALAATVLLKYGFHAATVILARFFMLATALEILAIAVAACEIRRRLLPLRSGMVPRAVAVGLACALILLAAAPRLSAFVYSHDTDHQRTYRFRMQPRDRNAVLACEVSQGSLVSLESSHSTVLRVTLRTFQQDPAPGDAAVAVCQLSGSGAPRPLSLQVLDPYAPGGLPDRMLQRVEMDGAEIYRHDVARDAGTGWATIPVGLVGAGTSRRVLIEVRAVRPEPGAAWGEAARTQFQLSRPN